MNGSWVKTLLDIVCAALLLLTGCHNKAEGKAQREYKYRVLTPEILGKISDANLEYAIIDYVYSKINGNWEKEYAIVTSLPKSFQMVYSTDQLEGEVNNGGFNQYFWNSSGAFQNEALEGYKTLGATEHIEIVEEAIKIYQGIAPKIKKFKDKGTLEAFSESYKDNPLDKCDEKFFKLNAGPIRIKYIREHLDQFTGK